MAQNNGDGFAESAPRGLIKKPASRGGGGGRQRVDAGGERGIRTPGTVLPVQRFSKAPLSTTQPSLREQGHEAKARENGAQGLFSGEREDVALRIRGGAAEVCPRCGRHAFLWTALVLSAAADQRCWLASGVSSAASAMRACILLMRSSWAKGLGMKPTSGVAMICLRASFSL